MGLGVAPNAGAFKRAPPLAAISQPGGTKNGKYAHLGRQNGDIIYAEYYCSDSCHREAVGNEYRGWFGCVELSYSQICENDGCNEILHGVEDDDI